METVGTLRESRAGRPVGYWGIHSEQISQYFLQPHVTQGLGVKGCCDLNYKYFNAIKILKPFVSDGFLALKS